ncbi:MAG: hypothetical protein U1E76_20035 [Planctomycetota bacterium]
MIRFLLDNPILVLLVAVAIFNGLVSLLTKRRGQEPATGRRVADRGTPPATPMEQATLEDNIRRAMQELSRGPRPTPPKPAARPPAAAKPKAKPAPPPPARPAEAPPIASLPPSNLREVAAPAAVLPSALQSHQQVAMVARLGLDQASLARAFVLKEVLDRPLADRAPAAQPVDSLDPWC